MTKTAARRNTMLAWMLLAAVATTITMMLHVPMSHAFQFPSPIITTATAAKARATTRQNTVSWAVANNNNNIDNNNNILQEDDDNHHHYHLTANMDRRTLFRSALLTASATVVTSAMPQNALAGGLVQFPVNQLKNRYHFMRAGPSELEDENIYSTNPLFLTNRENALSMAPASKSRQLILEACQKMKASGHLPTVAYHSLAANGMDTADILATELKLGRDRLLPEFTYLDQRGIGLWDSSDASLVKPAIWYLDASEAGKEGTGGRPPPNEDGTPNEVLGDQFVRLRQFLSLQESRTSGENILIIFPDGTGPALLSCMIAGIPLREVHCLEYAPGEVRLDITRESVLEQYAAKKDDPTYLAVLEDGKEKLAQLRSGDAKSFVSLKDQKLEQEQQRLDEEFERVKLIQRQKEEERLQKQKLAKEKAEQEKRDRRQAAKQQQKKDEEAAAAAAMAAANDNKAPMAANKEENTQLSMTSILGAVGGVAALGAVAAVALLGGDPTADRDASSKTTPSPPTKPTLDNDLDLANAILSRNATFASSNFNENNIARSRNGTIAITMPAAANALTTPSPTAVGNKTMSTTTSNVGKTPSSVASDKTTTKDPEKDDVAEPQDSFINEELDQLAAAQDALKSLLEDEQEAAAAAASKSSSSSTDQELQDLEAKQKGFNSYFDDFMDDGGDDWLQVLAEIRDEPDLDDDYVNGDKPVTPPTRGSMAAMFQDDSDMTPPFNYK